MSNSLEDIAAASQPKIVLLTLDEEEAGMIRLGLEMLRHKLERIAQANKIDATISSSDRTTIKTACTAILRLFGKIPKRQKGVSLQHIVRQLNKKYGIATRTIAFSKECESDRPQ